jgi:prepilin-type N-terminal cleavage/methylation domain-containing protein
MSLRIFAQVSNRVTCNANRRAFTLIEVLLALLLVSLGMGSVLTMTVWGTRESTKAVALATAYSSARSALYDPAIIDAAATPDSPNVTGYLNGYYLIRTIESSETLPASAGVLARIRVDVYWGNDGEALAGITSYLRL